jgi:DMSO reductase anchor subunit
MKPAFSVILLTTLIGAAQGLFLALYTLEVHAWLALLPPAEGVVMPVVGSGVVLALLAGGLLASFFHLGRPERAWRAAAQWRTSWLSREVIVLPVFMASVALWGLLHVLGAAIELTLVSGAVATLLAFALFYCTGMIYACIRFLAEWATPLTPLNYTLLGGASGFTLAAALAAALEPQRVDFLVGWAIILTLAAAVFRGASLWRNDRLVPRSTLQTAIGIKHPQIVQKSMGFMGGSFNTREFFHGVGARRLRLVRPTFVVLTFALPLGMLALALAFGATSVVLIGAAFAVQYVGLLAERWYFFAQANHPQNLYYRAVA